MNERIGMELKNNMLIASAKSFIMLIYASTTRRSNLIKLIKLPRLQSLKSI